MLQHLHISLVPCDQAMAWPCPFVLVASSVLQSRSNSIPVTMGSVKFYSDSFKSEIGSEALKTVVLINNIFVELYQK